MVVVAEVGVRVAAGPLPEPQVWSTPEIQYKVGLLDDHEPVDVALVGSSVVDVSVDASELGRPAFNAALGAASIGMVADFTRAVVVPELDPEVVVIGVTSRELNENAREPKEIEARFRDAPAVREALGTESTFDRIVRWASDLSALVRYRAALRDPDVWFGNATPEWGSELTDDDGVYLGFEDVAYRTVDDAGAPLGAAAVEDFHIGARESETLRSLIADLVADGRHVLLVATPVSDDYVALHPRGVADHRAFVRTLSTMADREGVPFLAAGIWEDRVFADPLHVNAAGQRRLTELVRDALDDQNWK